MFKIFFVFFSIFSFADSVILPQSVNNIGVARFHNTSDSRLLRNNHKPTKSTKSPSYAPVYPDTFSPTKMPTTFTPAFPGDFCVVNSTCSTGLCLGPYVVQNKITYGICADETVGVGCLDAYLESPQNSYTHPPGSPVGGCMLCDSKSVLVNGRCGTKCKCKKSFKKRPLGTRCCINCKNPCASGGYCIQQDRGSFCVRMTGKELGERCYKPAPNACKIPGICIRLLRRDYCVGDGE